MGPLDDAAEVKDEWEPRVELEADDIEFTRGDELLDAYARGECVRVRGGSLSLPYSGRASSGLKYDS